MKYAIYSVGIVKLLKNMFVLFKGSASSLENESRHNYQIAGKKNRYYLQYASKSNNLIGTFAFCLILLYLLMCICIEKMW